MKIIGLVAQNVKNIKAIEIQADGKSVVLSGKNEVGKSSVIDAITMALTGQMVERPIKDGETRAEVVINLGDYIVKRVWTEAFSVIRKIILGILTFIWILTKQQEISVLNIY